MPSLCFGLLSINYYIYNPKDYKEQGKILFSYVCFPYKCGYNRVNVEVELMVLSVSSIWKCKSFYWHQSLKCTRIYSIPNQLLLKFIQNT